ncbi:MULTISPECIES: SRPBCC family protein [unclassified Yoonia]|uniref:SRPBCC family protein n=1 Tax=unclassified Yoonia TaxID=2629118 RepID=UPI002B001F9C|nr:MULTISPECIES: SRPBCC family protein [unclassified Yoonia]
MRLETRTDIDAPVEHVFAGVSDFASFERRALREGATVARQDAGAVQVGSAWDITVPMRGRDRSFAAVLTNMAAPEGYVVTTQSDGLTVTTRVDLVALSPSSTRVTVTIDLAARTLTARLLVQSLKLAKGRLTERIAARVQGYATRIAEDYRKIR